MKKFFLFCMMALVTMCGLNSCSDDCDHDYIEYDYSKELVGTWTCMEPENEFAEALIIKADGSVEVTGLVNGELYETKGTIQVKNNKMIYKLDNGDEWEGRFEMVAGESFSMVLDDELDVRYTYHYCENDLSDEVVGMWVCNDFPTDGEADMMIETFHENGKSTLTGFLPLEGDSEQVLNEATDYKVVGDLLFIVIPAEKVGSEKPLYVVDRLIYTSNGTAFGDILTLITYAEVDNQMLEVASTFLRVKQHLDLAGQSYVYKSAYVTNAKGKDEDFSMFGRTFNMANINAANFDMAFGADLFCVVLNANSMTQRFRPDDLNLEVVTPITVDGNKVTLDYSAENPACRKVEIYMFQDQDNTQMHMYMPTSSFIDYIANMVIREMLAVSKIDPTDTAAIEKVYTDMEERVESINLSLVFKAISNPLN